MTALPLRRGLAAVLALIIAVAVAPAASAHTQLLRSTPGDGQTVERLTEIELEFSGALLEVGNQVTLETEAGESIELPATVRQGSTLTAPVPEAALTDGTVRLHWRVVAEDGHPIEGDIRFRYRAPAEATAASAEDGEDDPATEASTVASDATGDDATGEDVESSAEPTAEATAGTVEAAGDEPATSDPSPTADVTENNDDAVGAVWIMGALVVVAAGAAAAVAWRRRNSR